VAVGFLVLVKRDLHARNGASRSSRFYGVDLEIWPMGLALSRGSGLTLTIQGKDFERPGATGPLRGVAWFTHDDPTDRPPELFAGTNTLHTGGQYQSYLLLPILLM
jgi:uncharacterized protein